MTKRTIGIVWMALCAGCGAVDPDTASRQDTLGKPELSVDFAGCQEFAGIGLVPAANARPLVPAAYTLAGDASNAVIVVRVSHCQQATVGGHAEPAGTLSQIGINLVGPDTTADINNYTLWYTTTDTLLAATLNASGIRAERDPDLTFTIGAGSTLAIADSPVRAPSYSLLGPIVPPTADAVPFTASWWQQNGGRTAQMRTIFPAIRFGGATLTLSTSPSSELGALIGGSSLTFALLDSYNTFDAAQMTVTSGG